MLLSDIELNNSDAEVTSHERVVEASEEDIESRRGQEAHLRNEDEVNVRGKGHRFRARIRGFVRRSLCCLTREHLCPGDHDDVEDPARKQYRLEGSRVRPRYCLRFGSNRTPYNIGMVVSRHQMSMAKSLHWMFRVNFFFLFALSCVVFFAFTLLFAGFIFLAGQLDPQCLRVVGQPFHPSSAGFADAFTLSWTTFSTVGYGNAYPALGHENDSPSNCTFITAICSLESLIGVLYSGFCGAILFGKVLRIQSRAQVVFSDPIVIRYGSGVEAHIEDDEDEYTETGKKKIPCPVLEFRIVNRLFNDVGGEIIDATLNVVASIEPDGDAAGKDPGFERKETTTSSMTSNHFGDDTFGSLHSMDAKEVGNQRRVLDGFLMKALTRKKGTETEQSPRLLNKRIFSKMMMEASEHPFFKRVWLARHVLDEHSPLLKQKTRRVIRKCGGYWPEQLNSYQGVQESLSFHQILVSLNGVSNISASDVYAQKIYDHGDVNVGYEFVNLLYRDGDDLKVDIDLINDVREQHGGGGEPLTFATGEQ
ncbi:hypothetical protein MHU86_10005 [Fragilaria crotonensis]|nr:hypothetical protein MHU86_10005 [Fragilaria crotonensis]